MQIAAAKIYFPEEDKEEISAKTEEILATGQLTVGKYGKQFEKEFATYIGARYAVTVSSGTSALQIILRTLDIQGYSVIVPTNTFFATPAAVLHAGGKVIFADATENLCLDPESVERNIREDTRGVIIVHIGGVIPSQVRQVQQICQAHNLFLIEDAAHAHGSTLDGAIAGNFGVAAAFSFYPTKVITSGEGGMIVTNDEKVYQRALVFRDQGKAGFHGNIHTELGDNWRMSEIHAVIGLSQFHRLEEFIQHRRSIARIYDAGLQKLSGITALKLSSEVKSNYYKYTAILDEGLDRAAIKKELKEKYRVALSGEVYELPCHLQPIFKDLDGYKEGDYPVAEDLCRRMICLPVSAVMTEEETEYVLDCLRRVLK